MAREIITDLHGKESYENAVKISEALFSGDIKSLTESQINDAFKGLEPFKISADVNIIDLLVNVGVCSSKREAREFVSNNAISINGNKVFTEDEVNLFKSMKLMFDVVDTDLWLSYLNDFISNKVERNIICVIDFFNKLKKYRK